MGQMAMPTPMPQMPGAQGNFQPQAPQGSFQGLGADGNFERNVDRGASTGEKCFTFDVESHFTAEWAEPNAKVHVDTTTSKKTKKKTGQSDGEESVTEKLLEIVKGKIKNVAEGDKGGASPTKSRKKKKSALMHGFGNITLSVPCSLSTARLYEMVESIEAEGLKVKHVFNRPVSVIAGAAQRLFASPSMALHKISGSGDGKDDKILYLHFNQNEELDEVALVSGEGKKLAEDSGCTSGFSRFATLFSSAPSSDSTAIDVDTLVTDPNYAGATMVVVDGISSRSKAMQTVQTITKGLSKASVPPPAVVVDTEDAVRGACLLSAAELTSSKQYVRMDDGAWRLIFLLAFADGFLPHKISLKIEYGPDAPANTGAVEEVVLFGPVRAPKKEIGPANSALSVHAWERTFKHNLYNLSAAPKEVWPRVTVMEDGDKVVRVLHPLVLTKDKAKGEGKGYADEEVFSEVTLTMLVDPGLSSVRYRQDRGPSLAEVKANKRFYMLCVAALAALVLVVAAFMYGPALWESGRREEDIQWLKGVCSQHLSPESSTSGDTETEGGGGSGAGSDTGAQGDAQAHELFCANVEETIATFSKGEKLWLLHRKMQRGFGVKLTPPPSLGEL